MNRRVVRRAPEAVPLLSSGELSPLLARVYANRGIRQSAELRMSLQELLPPDTLTGADAAACWPTRSPPDSGCW